MKRFTGLFVLASGLLAAALTGCKPLPPPTPLAELNPQQAQGHAVYQAHCAVCHSDRTNADLHGPALRGIFKKEYLPSGSPANDDRVMATILHGRNTMPALGRTMDPDERDNLMAYLHTL